MTQPYKTIGEFVAHDFRTAAVFEKYGLDFCCGGKTPLESACSRKGIDVEIIKRELEEAGKDNTASEQFDEWELDDLMNYIVNVHHNYLRNSLPLIYAHTQKVASVHGDRHPEVVQIAEHFARVKTELDMHLPKEERVLFPYIKELVERKRQGIKGGDAPFFGTVQNPIRMMEIEHESAGNELAEIRRLSNDFTPPEDACTTYRVAFQELREFEADLHKHIHLENNILHKKAILLEQE